MFEALVIGLGAMGSAALYHLAARGSRVLGVDAFDPPHAHGSTHGRSRIIREAYYEHPAYVPLVRRAYENWAALERRCASVLFRKTGGLMMGSPGSGLVKGTMESASVHRIDVELLSAEEIMRRFPAIATEEGMVGVFEENAGMLFPEACVRSHLELAQTFGAEVWTGTCVLDLSASGDTITAETNEARITARSLVIAAGPWTPQLLTMLGVSAPLVVERQTMHWFDPVDRPDMLVPERLPVTMIEYDVDRLCYVMPDIGDGVKAAIHHEGAIGPLEAVERSVTPSDIAPVRALVERFVPQAAGALRESVACLYTNTPDFDFILDTIGGMPNIILVSACSGHGFKFASAIGELAARMSLGDQADIDISHFRASRFSRE